MNISVVTYNTPLEQLQRFLETVLPSEEVHHVYIIDNSPEPTEIKVQSARFNTYQDKIVYRFNNKNLGYGRAHNIAMRQSIQDGEDYHLVVNADIEFSRDILTTMREYMDAHQNVALLSPKVFYPNGELQYLCKQLPTPWDLISRRFLPRRWTEKRQARFEMRDTGYDHVMNVPYLSGCFMFLRVSALKEVGLFDERFFMYPEDIDLTRRLHERYLTLFYPEVSIIHNHAKASYRNLRMLWIHIVNMCRYFNKWGWW